MFSMNKQERINKLADALIAAKAAADAITNIDIGGACNSDSPTINLKHWHKSVVEAAAHAAGLTAIRDSRIGFWMFSICDNEVTIAQGSTRTLKSEAFINSLISSGFDATIRYFTD